MENADQIGRGSTKSYMFLCELSRWRVEVGVCNTQQGVCLVLVKKNDDDDDVVVVQMEVSMRYRGGLSCTQVGGVGHL